MDNDNSFLPNRTIDYTRLFYEIKRLKFVIVALIVAGVLVSVIYSNFFCTPLYVSSAKIYIFRSSEGQNNVDYVDFSTSSNFARDYIELINDRVVLDEVRQELGFRVSGKKNKISVSANDTGRIITVSVTNTSPERAKMIADKICEVSKSKIVELMGVELANIISEGNLPSSPVSPNKVTNLHIGLGVGAILSVIVIGTSYVFNNKISGTREVEKYLGLYTLATIPYNNGVRQGKNFRGGKA